MQTRALTATEPSSWSDAEIIDRVVGGETALYELLVRRYNQKLYRAVRAVLKDDTGAEDVMQDAYVRAFKNLRKFEGRSSFATWATRIAVNEALARLKSRQKTDTDYLEDQPLEGEAVGATTNNPESEMAKREARTLLEDAICGFLWTTAQW